MVGNLVLAGIAIAIVAIAWFVGKIFRARQGAAGRGDAGTDKSETLFASMFPDLQPHFHPENLVAYVTARRGQTPPRDGFTWKNAPGFGGLPVDIRFVKDREECALLDNAGLALGKFRYESLPAGAVIRLGDGKFTVDLGDTRDPAVRYWHPEREFKWTRRSGWRFKTPVAPVPFSSVDGSSSRSDDTWSSDRSGTSAAAAGFAGLGGTFDGGGASSGWDERPASGSPEGTGDSGIAVAESAGGSVGASDGDSPGDASSNSSSDSSGESSSDSSSDSSGESGSTSY